MTIVFTGENAYARDAAATSYIRQFIAAHGDVAVDRFDGIELEPADLISTVSSLPFLSDRRMVVVRGFGENKALLERVEDIVSAVTDSTDCILIEQTLDGRSKAYKYLQKHTDMRVFHAVHDQDLLAWVQASFAEAGTQVSRQAAQYLVDRVGPNQQLLASEIEKVMLYTHTPTPDSIADIVDYMPQGSVFAMLDSVFAGNITAGLALYDEQRAQGQEPQKILGMIAWQLHVLALVKTAGTMPPSEIASVTKLNPYVIRKNQSVVRSLSLARIKAMVTDALATDLSLKRSSVSADDALKTLILSFAT